MKAAAAALGIPQSVLSEAKSAGCPAFDSANRFNLLTFLSWFFARDPEQAVDWSQHLTKHKALREEQRYSKEKGVLIEKQSLVDEFKNVTAAWIADLDKLLAETLPPLTGGLPPADIAKINRARFFVLVDAYRAERDRRLESCEGKPESMEEVVPKPKRAKRAEIIRVGKKAGRKPAKA
jgi:hypothetical protein